MPSRKNFPGRVEARRTRALERRDAALHDSTVIAASQPTSGPKPPMKIATRIALLQWQANAADPANLWRLMIAWLTPGMREEPLRAGLHETPPKRINITPLIQRSRRVVDQINLHPKSVLVGA